MNRVLIAAMTLFASLAPSMADAAQLASPEGNWEIEFRDSRYNIEFCDGDSICGSLIWLAEGARSPENLQYLNKTVVHHAKRIGPARWKGQLTLMGESVPGIIQQDNDDQITITGCKFVVFCRSYILNRMPPDADPTATASN